jgi:hypothetical protein
MSLWLTYRCKETPEQLAFDFRVRVGAHAPPMIQLRKDHRLFQQ